MPLLPPVTNATASRNTALSVVPSDLLIRAIAILPRPKQPFSCETHLNIQLRAAVCPGREPLGDPSCGAIHLRSLLSNALQICVCFSYNPKVLQSIEPVTHIAPRCTKVRA